MSTVRAATWRHKGTKEPSLGILMTRDKIWKKIVLVYTPEKNTIPLVMKVKQGALEELIKRGISEREFAYHAMRFVGMRLEDAVCLKDSSVAIKYGIR